MAICHRSEVRVYDRTGAGAYVVLPAQSIAWSWRLGGDGFLSLQAESRADPLASEPDLLDDCVIKIALPLSEPGTTLTEVAVFAARGRAGVLWDGAGRQVREVRAAPTLYTVWSQAAILHPEGNVITQLAGDQRYFGWMSTIYDPTGDGWLTPTTIGQQDSHGYSTREGQPEGWPADLGDAYWISAPSGGGTRHLFIADLTLAEPTGVTVFFSSDESASVYVAGSLALQTSSVEDGYQSLSTWQGLLQAGTYRLGVDKTSIDHSGFDLGLGGDSGPADPILLAVAVGDGSGGWTPLLVTDTTHWKCYALDPETGEPPSLTPGAIVGELAAQAASRGSEKWAALSLDFDADVDSDSLPWPVREERAWRIAYDRHLDMIEGLGDLGFCPEVTPGLVFKAWSDRGTDRSATVTLATADEVDSVAESGVAVAGTYMPVETQDGWVVVNSPTAEAEHGRWEVGLSLGNAPSIAQGRRLGQKVLDDRLSRPESEWTVEFYARAGSVPFVDFGLGDTVMVSINGTPTPRVVLDLAAEQGHTETIVRWTAKTGDVARVGRFATQPSTATASGNAGSLVGDEVGGSAIFSTLVGTATATGEVGVLVGATGGAAIFATLAGAATASGAAGSLVGDTDATFSTLVGTATASGGVGSLAAGGGALSATFLQATSSATNASSYTFSGQSLGTAASDRTIIIAVGSRAVSGVTITSATIGGETVTIDEAGWVSDGSGNTAVAIGHVLVPSGTTGDVVLNFSDSQVRCGIALWRVTGADVSASSTDSAGGTTATVTGATDGLVVAATHASNGTTTTWSGVGEQFDITISDGGSRSWSGGDSTSTGTVAAVATTTSVSGQFTAAVAYAPA